MMFFNDIVQLLVHHCLEHGWRVPESKEHYQWFPEPVFGLKGCFVLISFFDVDIIVSLSDIGLGEYLGILDLCNQVWY
jgi:hypothetical protein